MKQRNRVPVFSGKILTLRQMFAVTGGEESTTAAPPPPVTAPEDTDPVSNAISNVLKTRHETAKNSISNVR